MFNDSKHITHILHEDACGISYVVQVALGEVRQAGAGHQVQVFQSRVETFAQAGVEVEQWGFAVDEKHGVVGGGFGAGLKRRGGSCWVMANIPRI